MLEPLSPLNNNLLGNIARRKARLALLLLLVCLTLSTALFLKTQSIVDHLLRLPDGLYSLGAAFLGLLMALLPVGGVAALLAAVFYSVNGIYLPHNPQTPIRDKLVLSVCIFIWFIPALSMLGVIINALWRGRVHFSQPSRDYFWATDPIPFLQALGFLGMGMVFFAFLAWKYWQPRLFPKASK